MGTKVQHKMYLHGYYPTRDLNNGTGNGSWSSHHEDKTFGQYYGIFSQQPGIGGYIGYEKEQLRQTILKHEMIFRQQLHELHRLYKIQADMMDQVRIKEPQNYLKTNGTSQQSRFSDGTGSKEYEFVDSRSKKLPRRLFDLELPADDCVIDDEEGPEIFPPNRNLSLQSGTYSISNGDASSSCINLKRNPGFVDLNEPVIFEEASGTASVDVLGNIRCSLEHIQRRDLSGSSCSGILPKETSQSPSKEKGKYALLGAYLRAICESSQIGSQKEENPDQNRREQSTRKTLFGLEICEDASFIAKESCVLQPLVPKSNLDNSDSSSISSWRQNLTSVQASSSVNMLPKSDNLSGKLIHGSESAWDRLAELCHQNSLCGVSRLESKESPVFHGSGLSFGYPNGVSDSNSTSGQAPQNTVNLKNSGWYGNSKSVDKANTFFPKSSQNEAISDSKRVLFDKEENVKGGLSWLRTEGGDSSSNRTILGVPIFEKQMPKDLSSSSSISKPSVVEVEVNRVSSVKPRVLLTDLNDDPIPSDEGEVLYPKSPGEAEVLVLCKATLRDCFDLNMSMTEEEAELNLFSSTSKTKIPLDINLEAPEMDSSRAEITESKLKEPFDSLIDEPGDGFIRDAADALIAISSSIARPNAEAPLCDSLKWFAEIISSSEFDLEKGSSKESDDIIPDGIDYFEYMTLNLTETEVEEPRYEGAVIEYGKEEVTVPRRGRRGQARRGRQRKDFQRDVLPGIISLSRTDVTEDLQTMEGLIRATGGFWESSLSQKNSPRGKGRGRKRLSAPVSPSLPLPLPHPQPQPQPGPQPQPDPQLEPPKCGELGLEETRLTGWGKRTRRPPRQRCLINHPSLLLQ